MAILANFKGTSSDLVVDQILARLKELLGATLRLQKYLRQLEMLSKLRNLQPNVITKIEAMPITYDLETDIRFLQGADKKNRLFVLNLLTKTKHSPELIASLADVTLDFVQQMKLEMTQAKTKTKKKKPRKKTTKPTISVPKTLK